MMIVILTLSVFAALFLMKVPIKGIMMIGKPASPITHKGAVKVLIIMSVITFLLLYSAITAYRLTYFAQALAS